MANAPCTLADRAHGRSVVLDLRGDAVELDEQHRLRTLRVAGPERLLGGLDREPVHHLDRGWSDAVRRRSPRRPRRPRRASGTRPAASSRPRAARTTRSVTSVAMPSVPSEPTSTPSRSGPSGSSALPPSSTTSPVGSTTVMPGHVRDGEPVLQAVRAARVLGHVAADRADLLARRIGRIEEPVGLDGAGDVEIRDAGLHDHSLRFEVDLEDRGPCVTARSRRRPQRAARHRRAPCPRRGRRTGRPQRRMPARPNGPRPSTPVARHMPAGPASR